MSKPQRFSFVAANSELGEASLRPLLPITLVYQDQHTATAGLLDTGAAVNVLPFRTGIALGAMWKQQTTPLRLTGNLAQYEARLLLVSVLPLHGQQQSISRCYSVRSTFSLNSMSVSTAPHWPLM
jgi:hypothetical protein